jgi:hypothetical protein
LQKIDLLSISLALLVRLPFSSQSGIFVLRGMTYASPPPHKAGSPRGEAPMPDCLWSETLRHSYETLPT